MTAPNRDTAAGITPCQPGEDDAGCVVISDVMADVARILKEAEMGPQQTPEVLWTGAPPTRSKPSPPKSTPSE